MKWIVAVAVVVMLSFLIVDRPTYANFNQTSSTVQLRDNDDQDGSKLTPQERSASDALMKQGLSDLLNASSSLQGNNVQGALQSMRAGYTEMIQARPIYHGHRKASVNLTERAGLVLDANRRNAVLRASELLGKAITQAQTAVASW